MRADPDEHEIFGLHRAVPVLGIFRLLLDLGVRVTQLGGKLGVLQRLEGLRRAIDDEDRVATPLHDDLLAGLDRADADLERGAGRDRRRVGLHLVDQRPNHGRGADDADGARRDVEEVALRGILETESRLGGSCNCHLTRRHLVHRPRKANLSCPLHIERMSGQRESRQPSAWSASSARCVRRSGDWARACDDIGRRATLRRC